MWSCACTRLPLPLLLLLHAPPAAALEEGFARRGGAGSEMSTGEEASRGEARGGGGGAGAPRPLLLSAPPALPPPLPLAERLALAGPKPPLGGVAHGVAHAEGVDGGGWAGSGGAGDLQEEALPLISLGDGPAELLVRAPLLHALAGVRRRGASVGEGVPNSAAEPESGARYAPRALPCTGASDRLHFPAGRAACAALVVKPPFITFSVAGATAGERLASGIVFFQ